MPEYTLEFLEERFAALPESIRGQMMSLDTARAVEDVGEKHHLHIDQIGELSDETGLVLLGLTRTGDFAAHIAKRTGIDAATANAVAAEIDAAVFKPIKASLVAFSGYVSRGETSASAPQKIAVRSDTYREAIDPLETKPLGSDNPSVESLPKREDLLREIEDAPRAPTIPRATSIAQTFPQKPPEEKVDASVAPTPPLPATPASGASVEKSPSLVRVGGMVSVPMVKDLIHEKATAKNDDMIKKKLAETFSLAPAKTTETKSVETPAAPPAVPVSEAPKGQGHDPYREPIK